jgi:hypothetical protein
LPCGIVVDQQPLKRVADLPFDAVLRSASRRNAGVAPANGPGGQQLRRRTPGGVAGPDVRSTRQAAPSVSRQLPSRVEAPRGPSKRQPPRLASAMPNPESR